MKIYDICVVGAGISGLSIAEMCSRMQIETLLIDRQPNIAMESTAQQHGWFHTGALYSNMKNGSQRRSFLENLEHLHIFYARFPRMNISVDKDFKVYFKSNECLGPTERYWFNFDGLRYLYEDGTDFNLSKNIVLKSKQPVIYGPNKTAYNKFTAENLQNLDSVKDIESCDRSMNTDLIVTDLFEAFKLSGGKFLGNSDVVSVSESQYNVKCITLRNKKQFYAKKVVFCGGESFPKPLMKSIVIETSYSPLMIIVNKRNDRMGSFVKMSSKLNETINVLDHYCDGVNYGVVGSGEGFKQPLEKADFNFLLNDWTRRLNGCGLYDFDISDAYFGVKNFVLNRNIKSYQYHIKTLEDGLFYVNPGKFTLSFTLAVNFVRDLIGHSAFYSRFTQDRLSLNNETVWQPKHLTSVKSIFK